MVKNPPANTGEINAAGSIHVSGRSLGGEHDSPLQYNCLENPIPWTEEPDGLQSMGSQRVRHD